MNFVKYAISHNSLLQKNLLMMLFFYILHIFPKAQFAQLNTAMWIINSLIWMVVPLILGKFLDYTSNNYNHMLLFGGFFAICGVWLLLIVYRYYIRFGGDLNYQAPSLQ